MFLKPDSKIPLKGADHQSHTWAAQHYDHHLGRRVHYEIHGANAPYTTSLARLCVSVHFGLCRWIVMDPYAKS